MKASLKLLIARRSEVLTGIVYLRLEIRYSGKDMSRRTINIEYLRPFAIDEFIIETLLKPNFHLSILLSRSIFL